MSLAETSELDDVLAKVRSWTAEMRLNLAEQLLRSLHRDVDTNGLRGVPASQVRGIGAGTGAPPDDDTVQQWIDEHRMEKYG